MTPAAALRRCIQQCAKSSDGRGPWQAERACLARLGEGPINQQAAAAARRLGEWLRTV